MELKTKAIIGTIGADILGVGLATIIIFYNPNILGVMFASVIGIVAIIGSIKTLSFVMEK